MNTRDFGFLYRKETIILCLLLVSINFAQIASERQISTGTRLSEIEPIFVLENPFFETLGIFLPWLVAVYLFMQKRTKGDYSWVPPTKYLVTFSIILITFMAIPLPDPLNDSFLSNNTSVTITGPIMDTTTSLNTDPNNPTSTSTSTTPSVDVSFLGSFLEITRTAFLFLVVFLPLIIIYLQQRRSKNIQEEQGDDESDLLDQDEKTYSARTILECYYQASNRLEEMGADDSESITPSEFSDDVIDKEIMISKDMENLTSIFEEAKFSDHEMTNEQVEIVKKIASDVIISDKSSTDNLISQTDSGKEEDNDEPN
ncbi:MAG: DUF4129 domain-containing protein [Candidatus Hodarchaeales archaeon]